MAADAGPTALHGPIVGRERALDVLLSAIEAADGSGGGRTVFVGGEPGIGKTRLVAEAVERSGRRAVWARCWHGDGAPAYWPWRQVLRDLAADDVSILESGPVGSATGQERSAGDAADARFRLFDAVADVLAAAAQPRALAVVLDDLHWADAASIRLVQFLARDPRVRRLTVIATYRDSDLTPRHALAEVIGEIGDVHLHLDGLDEQDVMTLATMLVGDAAALPPAALLRRRSGGNPLFVRELVRLIDDEPRRGRAAPRQDVPTGLGSVVDRRVGRLSASAREVLASASVIGADFDLALLASATDRSGDELLAAIDEARAAGLVEHEPATTWCRFVHAVVREVLYESLGLYERALCHARIAAAIEARYGTARVTEIAHHMVHAAAVGGHEGAVEWAVRAAEDSLERLAYEQGAAWYERALALLPVDPGGEREAELLIRRGEAWVAAGDVPAAREAFRQAAALARHRRDADQLTRAALGLGGGFGGFEVPPGDDAQIQLLEEALEMLGPEASSQRAWVLSRLSVALSSMGAEARRRASSDEAIMVARQVGDAAALAYALAAHCDVIAGPDWSEARRDDAAEVVALANQTGDRQLELLGRRLRVVALLELGDLASADHDIDQFARVTGGLAQPLYRWYVPLWRGMRALMSGDVDEAARWGREAEELGRRAHSDNAAALTLTQRWVHLRAAGRYAESAAAVADVLGLAPGGTPTVSGARLLQLRSVIAAQLGDLELASSLVDRWVAAGVLERTMDSEWLPETAQLAEVASIVGADEVAERILEQLRPYAHRYCVEGIGAAFTGSVSWYLAMLSRTVGNIADAEVFDVQARAAHRRVGLVGDPPALVAPGEPRHRSTPSRAAGASMTYEGATWAVTYDGTTQRLRDTKGVRDLAVLLGRPGHEVHCLELAGGSDVGGDVGPALDSRARRAYEQRIRDLHDDIDEARQHNDPVRQERAEAELDALVQQLSEAFGLAGRARPSGAAAERARTTVTSRIRSAIRHASDVHPRLGGHLEHSIRTGTWCVYRPEEATTWEITRPTS